MSPSPSPSPASPYLDFAGDTREAMEFHQGNFGELVVPTFADMGITPMPTKGVMHAALRGGPVPLYASDAMPGVEQSWGGTRVYASSRGEAGDLDTISGWFVRLAGGGHVGQPLQQQVWGDLYGQVSDRFGIEWMVKCPGAVLLTGPGGRRPALDAGGTPSPASSAYWCGGNR